MKNRRKRKMLKKRNENENDVIKNNQVKVNEYKRINCGGKIA